MRAARLLMILLIVVPPLSAAAETGGPDSFGYIWSDDLAIDWIDPDGGQVLFLGDDAWYEAALEFAFSFYGVDYESVNIVSNGYLTFPSAQNTWVNQCPLPDPTEPNGSVYLYWHDLIPPADGVVSYKRLGEAPYRHFLASYENVAFFGYPYVLTAQVLLTESVGWIEIQYLDSGEGGRNATVGIEDADGATALTYGCNDDQYLADETVLFFGKPGAENLRADTEGPGLRVAWDDPSGAEYFLVESRLFGDSVFHSVGETEETVMYDPSAEECYSYDYRISAFAGERGRAAPVMDTLTFFPRAPTDLVAADIGGQRVDLFWNENSGCEETVIVERKPSGGSFETLVSLPPDTQTYRDEAPVSGCVYRVRVTGRLLSSDYSNEASAEVHLLAPADLSAEPYSDTKIELTWTDVAAGENGWSVERRLESGNETAFTLVADLGPDATSFLDFDLTPETTYVYRVFSFVTYDAGPYSNEASATTPEPDTPPTDDETDDTQPVDDTMPAAAGDDDEDEGGCCGA